MRFISAHKIFDGTKYLPSDTVIIVNNYNNQIIDITTTSQIDLLKIEKIDGILCPGFVNAHCHLELSHLKNKINKGIGIVEFGKEVISKRHQFSKSEIQQAIKDADHLMYQNGISAVADICNSNDTLLVKQESKIKYHSFIELIGFNPKSSNSIFDEGIKIMQQFVNANLSTSLVAHAPYSVSVDLIKKITAYANQQEHLFSIHNQESEHENELFVNATGAYIDLYRYLNINVNFFSPTKKSSLLSVLPSLHKDVQSILVHNSFTSLNDFETAQSALNKVFWCICPLSNLFISGDFRNFNLMATAPNQLIIGTDSLASNQTLSIIDEINGVLQRYPGTTLELLLQAATYNGAKALQLNDSFGAFKINATPGINLLQPKNKTYKLTRVL